MKEKGVHHKAGEMPTLKNGNPIAVDRQFGKPNGNPRNNGSWKKEDTPRYKLEKMITLNEKELEEIWNDKDRSLFERKLAKCIRYGEWKELQQMIDEVYGRPKTIIESHVNTPIPLVDLTKRKKNGKRDGTNDSTKQN